MGIRYHRDAGPSPRAFVLVMLVAVVGVLPGPAEWENLGIGGAGGIYTPSSSPEDPDFMLASSDMSGSYRSLDGGRSWETIHWRQINSSHQCHPAFAPGDVVYWVSGDSRLVVSRDKANTWSAVSDSPPWGQERIGVIAPVWESGGEALLVGTDKGLWQSGDSGGTWRQVAPGKVHGIVCLDRDVFVAIGRGLMVSTDSGGTFGAVEVPQAAGIGFHGLVGGRERGRNILLGLVRDKGVLRSEDNGQTWRLATGDSFDQIVMPFQQTRIAYAAVEGKQQQVWRTRNSGKTWECCFDLTLANIRNGECGNIEPSWIQFLHWGFQLEKKCLGVCPTDPSTVLVSSQCDCYISRDGGRSWKQCVTNRKGTGKKPRYCGNGLEVTSCWELYFDPHRKDKIYVAYTDIGFLQSDDRGETWAAGIPGNPWGNTTYGIAFDPFTKGRFYAACSGRHDIPHWTNVSPNSGDHHVGGVVEVSGYGSEGRAVSNGLPELPCTDVIIDRENSKKNALVLYAAMFGRGVFKSSDSGMSWTEKSNGLGGPGNRHVYDLGIHPVSGDLYCSITACREGTRFSTPSGLWKSEDGGESWRDIAASLELRWAGRFALHPTMPDTVYLTAATPPGFDQCGLYKTTDGGETWTHVLDQRKLATVGGRSFDHVFHVTLDPGNPDRLFVGSSDHGLWFSPDAGRNWRAIEEIPHKNCHRVTWDPKDKDTIYVTTYGGGIWRGPAPE